LVPVVPLRVSYSPTGRRDQRGLALMLVVAILVTGSAFLAVRSLNAAAVRADRYRVTQEALIKAKEALIAYAVSDTVRPGELPCPDVNDDGRLVLNEDFVGSNCVSLVGRLPWITLGLPDLRDAAGERLWYALSNDFHANGSVALNSDTAYRMGNTSLTVSGTQPASNVLAIVFSAGSALMRADGVAIQNRSCVGGACDAAGKCTTTPSTTTPKCSPVNYLDISGVDNADANTTFVSAAESETFNDRLIPILSDDIMSLVERRAGRELAQKLRDHFDAWQIAANVNPVGRKGFYPWAATFSDPTTVSPGVSNNLIGGLPLSAASVVWTSASFPLGFCVGVGTNQIQCFGLLICIVVCPLNVTGRVGSIATAFVDPPNGSEVTTTTVGVSIGGSPTSTWTLNSAMQALDFSYSGGSILGVSFLTVSVNAPSASAWTNSSWLATNNWNQVSYYALSSGYAITGANNCGGAVPQCVTVSNTAAPNDNKEAVMVTTGRALPGTSARPVTPPASIVDFLEGGNQTPADLVFERNLRSSAFNDQPAVVRP